MKLVLKVSKDEWEMISNMCNYDWQTASTLWDIAVDDLDNLRAAELVEIEPEEE